ncbi:hypothetical protein EJB05_27891, partial [Eragrostis curvula]
MSFTVKRKRLTSVEASQVPNKGRGQKSSTPKATSSVTGEREEEIRTTPKGTGRSGKDLERINKGMDKKLAIHISEGKKRPEVPLQAAKLATEGGIVLRQHIPVLPHWKMYRDEREREHLVQFFMDTTSKPVISACADMMKCGQRQMRYKLKKKFFNNTPANDQWEALVKLWSSPQHKDAV